MKYKYNNDLNPYAKSMRKQMTKEERHLWFDCIKTIPLHFYRQKMIGNYIVDFYCPQAKLVIEVDGSQHFEPAGEQYDTTRDEFLSNQGLTVVRYNNHDINTNFDGVCQDLYERLRKFIER